jgi:hypothetical protein
MIRQRRLERRIAGPSDHLRKRFGNLLLGGVQVFHLIRQEVSYCIFIRQGFDRYRWICARLLSLLKPLTAFFHFITYLVHGFFGLIGRLVYRLLGRLGSIVNLVFHFVFYVTHGMCPLAGCRRKRST